MYNVFLCDKKDIVTLTMVDLFCVMFVKEFAPLKYVFNINLNFEDIEKNLAVIFFNMRLKLQQAKFSNYVTK